MRGIRVLVEADLPQVAALHSRVYKSTTRSSPQALESYFRQILLQNPWYDAELPSLIYEETGQVVGFMGIIPRRMCLDGRPLRMAVACQLCVDPDRRNSLAAFHLLQEYMRGPQDVALTDGASSLVYRIWQKLGGETLPLYNLYWVKPLRPARTILALYSRSKSVQTGKRDPSGLVPQFTGMLCDLADLVITPLVKRSEQPSDELETEELDAATLLSCLSQFTANYVFRPQYDLHGMEWLLDQAAKKTMPGPLQSVLVRRKEGRPAGWYLYYLHKTGLSEVLQIGAREDSIGLVLNHLFDHAQRRGAVALHGRIEPRFIQALSDHYCVFHGRASKFLIRAENPRVKAALLAGDAFLTRTEGEWWMRFTGEPLDKG